MTVHTILAGDCDQTVTDAQAVALMDADLIRPMRFEANDNEIVYSLTRHNDVDEALATLAGPTES